MSLKAVIFVSVAIAWALTLCVNYWLNRFFTYSLASIIVTFIVTVVALSLLIFYVFNIGMIVMFVCIGIIVLTLIVFAIAGK